MQLEIHRAQPEEFEVVRDFYYSLIDSLEGTKYHPKWARDIYPAQEDLRAAIHAGELYYGRINDQTDAGNLNNDQSEGRIAAAMVVNQKCNEEYQDVNWPLKLTQNEFVVIHMLGVHGDFAGRGLAKELVRYAVKLAKAAGMKAIRLDVLKGNLPAEKLYEREGFVYVETIQLFYEDTGRVDFKMYELPLG